MTSLEDKAAGGGPEIVLVGDQPHRPDVRILDDELRPADELTPEGEFPEHGSFLAVTDGDDQEYWECPKALAAAIVEKGEEIEREIPGLRVSVSEVVKTASGEWRYVVDVWDPEDE